MFSIILPDVVITGDANTQKYEIRRNLISRMNISNTSKGTSRIIPSKNEIKHPLERQRVEEFKIPRQHQIQQAPPQGPPQQQIQQQKLPDYTNASNFIDVHTFDGQLYTFEPLRNYSLEEIRSKINVLLKDLTVPQAINSVNVILNDMPSAGLTPGGLYSNVQYKDNMRADIILADILSREYKDVFGYLEEQLSDISTLGLCNSGRVNRLYQIWLALKEKA